MPPLIDIKNLSYAYPDGTKALDNVSLSIEEGESVGIIGPNGAGKSTLLMHLNGLLHNGNNDLKIANIAITKENLLEIRKLVALVFQDPDHQLFMPTVFDDVSFGPINMGLSKEQVLAQVDLALQEVDMQQAKHRSSHHLSFGEKKRIALATVLSMNPRILALDEPTSNLDPKHRWELISLLKTQKKTMLIASHDLEMVRTLCAKTVILNKGQVKAYGETATVLSDRALLKANDLEKP